jgi:hypothetical protein
MILHDDPHRAAHYVKVPNFQYAVGDL